MILMRSKIPAKTYHIEDVQAGQRIDNFLLQQLKGLPRSRIYHLLRKKRIKVNHKKAKACYRLESGDKIDVPAWSKPESFHKLPSTSDCDFLANRILFEDEHLIVIDKPAGMAVHKGTGVPYGVIEIMKAVYPQYENLSLAHRLDRGTSGCLLLAKNYTILSNLHDLFRRHAIDKHYQALLCGVWGEKGAQRVQQPLLRDRISTGEDSICIDQEGKVADTQFIPLQCYQNTTLVDVITTTGRMHQIRVHARYLGMPVAGDLKYGDKIKNADLRKLGLKRLFLHASHIGFTLPHFGMTLNVNCSLPNHLNSVLDHLKLKEGK